MSELDHSINIDDIILAYGEGLDGTAHVVLPDNIVEYLDKVTIYVDYEVMIGYSRPTVIYVNQDHFDKLVMFRSIFELGTFVYNDVKVHFEKHSDLLKFKLLK